MEKIKSLQNSRIKAWASLHQKKYRDESGLFLVEGDHLIEEALKANCVETIISDGSKDFDFKDVVFVSEEVMKKLSKNVSSISCMAVCKKMEATIQEPTRIVLLENVQDPGNLGTIIRSAVAFRFDAIYLSEDCCDTYNEKTIRSSQGAIFSIPIFRGNIKDYLYALKKEGFYLVGTDLQESHPLGKVEKKEKMAFIFGNEGSGLSEECKKSTDENIRIEMQGFESLNVAVAAGIILYQFQK